MSEVDCSNDQIFYVEMDSSDRAMGLSLREQPRAREPAAKSGVSIRDTDLDVCVSKTSRVCPTITVCSSRASWATIMGTRQVNVHADSTVQPPITPSNSKTPLIAYPTNHYARARLLMFPEYEAQEALSMPTTVSFES